MRILLLISLASLSAFSMEVNNDILRRNAALDNTKLIYDKEHFIVDKNGKEKVIQRYNMSKELRSLSDDQVKALLSNKNTLLYLRKLSDNSYALELQGRLKGGTGPVTAGIVWGVVSVGGYTAMLLGGLGIIAASTAVAGPGAPSVAAPALAMISAGGGITAGIAGVQSAAVSASLWTLAIPIPLP